ncbi:tail fiber domain-containing protein [Bacteroidota bacterium]
MDQPVTLKISIIDGSYKSQYLKGNKYGYYKYWKYKDRSIVYSEIHYATTDEFGLVNLKIGLGSALSGAFDKINWAKGNYYVKIEMDEDGGSNFKELGSTQLLSVPYALYAQSSGNLHYSNNKHCNKCYDNDKDSTNELITFMSLQDNILKIAEGGDTNYLDLSYLDLPDEDDQQLSYDSISYILYLEDGGEINLSNLVNDADDDPTNEIQDISLDGNELSISNGSTLILPDEVDDADADPTNELQDISISGNEMSISNGSTVIIPDEVEDADADPNNELQDISISGNELSISSGSTVIIPDEVEDADADPNNELQDISISGNELSISNGSTVIIPDEVEDADADPTNEIIDEVILVGNNLIITEASEIKMIDLSALINDTDADPNNELQDISISDNELSISNGSTVIIPDEVDDADADPTNELINNIDLVGNELQISDAGGIKSLDLSQFDNSGSDDQNISYDPVTHILTLEDGGSIDLSVLINDADASVTNELQDISLNGNELSISNGSTVILPDAIDDDDADPNNEIQDIYLIDNELTISGGSTVFLTDEVNDADADPTNEIQDISLNGSELSISGGSTITLPGAIDDADADPTNEIQDLLLIGSTLKISDNPTASEIDLSPYMGINTDNQDLSSYKDGNNVFVDITNGNSTFFNVNDADADVSNELIASVVLDGTDLRIQDAGGTRIVDLSALTNQGSDDQQISYNPSNKILTLEDGGTVDLSGLSTDGDADPTNELIYNAILDGNELRIQDAGGTKIVDLSSLLIENTDDQQLSYNAVDKTLSLESGGSVDLSGLSIDDDANSTNELIQSFVLNGTQILIQDAGGTKIIELNEIINDDIDNQQLSYNPADNTLSLDNGGIVDLSDLIDDDDNDATNELVQIFTLDGTELQIQDAGGTKIVDLGELINEDIDNQQLSYNPLTKELQLENGGIVNLAGLSIDEDADPYNEIQNISKTDDLVTLSGSGGSFIDEVEDADADPVNEIQNLSLDGLVLSITNNPDAIEINMAPYMGENTDEQNLSSSVTGNEITIDISGGTGTTFDISDNDNDPDNEIQDLELIASTLKITNNTSATEIDLSPYMGVNTDNQEINATKTDNDVELAITGGNITNFNIEDDDSDPINEIQDISIDGHDLSISNGSTITIPDAINDADADPNNELIYNALLSGNNLIIQDAGGLKIVDLSTLNLTSQDDQQLSYNASVKELSLENGGTVDLSGLSIDADADPANELIHSVNLVDNTLEINDAGGTKNVDLSTLDISSADDQQLSYNAIDKELSLENGGAVDLSGLSIDDDADPNNELVHAISLNGNNLQIHDAGGVKIVDLSDLSLESVDDQQLSYDPQSKTLTLEDGGMVNLSSLINDADADASNELIYSVSLDGNDLEIEDASGVKVVDLSTLQLPNVDDQQLSYDAINKLLSLEDGGTVILSSLSNDADADPTNEVINAMSLNGYNLEIEDAGGTTSVDLSIFNNSGTDNQEIEYDPITHILTLEDGGMVDLTNLLNDADADPANEIQDISILGNELTISNGSTITLPDAVEDADADPNNEIQALTYNPDLKLLTLYNGGTVDLSNLIDDADADASNEIQSLVFSGNELTISEGNTVVLPDAVNDADADPVNEIQSLYFAGNQLSISDGNSITIPDNVEDADADPANEIQDITIAGNDLTISGGSTITLPDAVDDADADPLNEIQSLYFAGNQLSISDGNSVTIPDNVEDADADPANEIQDITIAGNDLTISGGSTITLPDEVNDADANAYNEINQALSLIGNTLEIEDAGGRLSVDLSTLDLPTTDNQQLQYNEITHELSLDNGGSVDLNNLIDDADADPTNEMQDIALVGNDLTISGGSTITLPAAIDDADADPGNEIQALSIAGQQLSISGGNSVTLPTPSETDPVFIAHEASNINNAGSGNIITVTERTKLNGIEVGAEVNVKSDWTAESGDQQILNKPATFPPSSHMHISENITDATHENDPGMIVKRNEYGGFNADSVKINTLSFNSDNIKIINNNSMNPESGNILIGFETGMKLFANAHNNIGMGSSALGQLKEGMGNTAIGHFSLSNMEGEYSFNTAIGFAAGNGIRGNNNVLIGNQAGYDQEDGDNRLIIQSVLGDGSPSLPLIYGEFDNQLVKINGKLEVNDSLVFNNHSIKISGFGEEPSVLKYSNILLGFHAGRDLEFASSNNIAIGNKALQNNNEGIGNTAIGYEALSNIEGSQSYNTALGYHSGANVYGRNNVLIGCNAGFGIDPNGDNRLIIQSYTGEGEPLPPLIYGEFDRKLLQVNGSLVVNKNLSVENSITVENGITGNLNGNANTATTANYANTASSASKWSKTIQLRLTGRVSGSVNFDGSSDVTINTNISETDPQVGTIGKDYVPCWNGSTLVTGSIQDYEGDVGIGVKPNPSYRLNVNGSGYSGIYATGSIVAIEGIASGSQGVATGVKGKGWCGVEGEGYYGIVGRTNGIYAGYFYGDVMINGTIYPSSDIRLKKNIEPLENSLAKIMEIQGVTYNWRTEEFKDRGFTNDTQIGLIAQEVETVLPELISEDHDGYKAISYSNLTAVLVEAIKEQQTVIETQQEEIESIKKQLKEIMKALEE